MGIIRHTTEYSDAYLDISYYVPPHLYTAAEFEMFFISPRPQFPPHEPPVPVREFLIVSDLNDWFEDILDEAEEEIEIETIADPIAHRDIVTAFFNATNIKYPKKKKKGNMSGVYSVCILGCEEKFYVDVPLAWEDGEKGDTLLAIPFTKAVGRALRVCKLTRLKNPPHLPNLMSKMQAVAAS